MFRHELASAGLHRPELTDAYRACGRYLRQRNAAAFPVARYLLPPGKRPYYDAIIAFCGYADDLLDTTDATAHERGARFDAFRRAFLRQVEGAPRLAAGPDRRLPDPPAVLICRALAHTVRTWDVELASAQRFLETLRTDLETTTYPTFDALEGYMSAVSGDVSTWVNTLLEPRDEEAAAKAVALSHGVYLLDFLQDIAEDIALGRVYLPLADLTRHGLTRAELTAAATRRRMTAPLRETVRFEAERVRRYFRAADGWHRQVHPSGRELPRQYLALGRTALDGLLRDDCDVFRPRASTRLLGTARAGTTTARSYLRARRARRAHPHALPG